MARRATRKGEADPFDTPEKAYAEAERLIAEAQASNATELRVHLRYLERLPPSLAGLTALTGLRLDGTQVADLAPLAGLTALQSLWLDGTQVADLAPLAGMTRMIDVVQNAWTDETQRHMLGILGLRFAEAPVSRRAPFDRLSKLEQPARTIETINEVRRQLGLPAHVPRKHQLDEPSVTLQRLIDEPAVAVGVRFEVVDERLRADYSGSDRDEAVARDPLTKQIHGEVRRKAQTFSGHAIRLDNAIGWAGIGSSAKRFSDALRDETEAVPRRIAEIWSLAVELGSFLEQDRQLQSAPDSNASPLDPENRRSLADLIRTAAPWVRRFPTAQELDDQAGAFLTKTDYLEPAQGIFRAAGTHDVISDDDRKTLEALVAAARRGEFQGQKAAARSTGSARNLLLHSMSILAAFYMGVSQNIVAEKSVIARKAGDTILAAEQHVLALFKESPPDMQVAIQHLIKRLREEQDNQRDRATLAANAPRPRRLRGEREE